MDLLEKKYYSLKEIANATEFTINDLLHYGATNKLKIATYLLLSSAQFCLDMFDSDDYIYGYDGLYYVCRDDLEYLSVNKLQSVDVQKLSAVVSDYFDNGKLLKDVIYMFSTFDYTVNVRACDLLILHDDFMQFMNNRPCRINFNEFNNSSLRYLNTAFEHYSEELAIAVNVWLQLYDNGTYKPNKSHKAQILKMLDKYNLSNSAKERIATVVNPNKGGGVPPSGHQE